jgi:hypothetical protein
MLAHIRGCCWLNKFWPIEGLHPAEEGKTLKHYRLLLFAQQMGEGGRRPDEGPSKLQLPRFSNKVLAKAVVWFLFYEFVSFIHIELARRR